jgi:bisphosphoglycerate-independent phosphoglycerate mutase (AlkP superfamily)
MIRRSYGCGEWTLIRRRLAGLLTISQYDAAVVAVEACDKAIAKIYEGCKKENYVLFITADHGNAEEMKMPDGSPKTSHTTNKYVVGQGHRMI